MTTSWVWSAEVWRYDPSVDSWTQLEDFPGTVRRWANVANVQGRMYYGMGTNGTNFNDWWEFDHVASNEEIDVNHFTAYPNPVTDHVRFKAEKHAEFDVAICDLQGKTIATISSVNGTANFNRRQTPSGMYFYKVLIDGKAVQSDQIIFK